MPRELLQLTHDRSQAQRGKKPRDQSVVAFLPSWHLALTFVLVNAFPDTGYLSTMSHSCASRGHEAAHSSVFSVSCNGSRSTSINACAHNAEHVSNEQTWRKRSQRGSQTINCVNDKYRARCVAPVYFSVRRLRRCRKRWTERDPLIRPRARSSR